MVSQDQSESSTDEGEEREAGWYTVHWCSRVGLGWLGVTATAGVGRVLGLGLLDLGLAGEVTTDGVTLLVLELVTVELAGGLHVESTTDLLQRWDFNPNHC